MTLHTVRRMDFWFWLPLLVAVSLCSDQCDLTPGPGPTTGRVTGISCQKFDNMTVGQCVLQCLAWTECRVAYVECGGSVCVCVLCRGAHAIDFSIAGETFYLKGRVLAAENMAIPPARTVSIPGGLSVGQVFVARVSLTSDRTYLLFLTPADIYAFVVEFRMYTRAIVRNTRFQWGWSYEERSKPHFNFAAGQEIEIVIIVRQADYMVYIDKVPFFTFKHRYTDLESIQTFESSGIGAGGNFKSFFLTI